MVLSKAIKIMKKKQFCEGLHGSVLVSTFASQQEGPWSKSHLGPFYVEFSPRMRGFSPGLSGYFSFPKTCMLG